MYIDIRIYVYLDKKNIGPSRKLNFEKGYVAMGYRDSEEYDKLLDLVHLLFGTLVF